MSFKIDMVTVSETGISNVYVDSFKKYFFVHGIDEKHLGKKFLMKREEYILVGYDSAKRKSPMIIQKVSNAEIYATSVLAIKVALATD